MNRHLTSVSVGAILAFTVAGAFAQSTPPASSASAPGAVGVTPQDAAKANQQAVPRSDTATVVRTAPSAATRASAAVGSTTGSTGSTGTTGATGAAATTGAASAAGGTGQGGMGTGGARTARADRN